LHAGAAYYIAPNGYPEASSSLFYITSFYYFLFVKKMTVEDAHTKAKYQDEETSMFVLYKK
jgi:hypothetical protein